MTSPRLSVVMGVRDGGKLLAASIASVLTQEGADLELLVVDDGSVDESRDVARAAAAADSRVRLVEQGPAGLTAALIRGCDAARGDYVARQDCGDRSLPGRLADQVASLDGDPRLVLVGGGTRFLGPEGEHLFDHVQTSADLTRALEARRLRDLAGPTHHGCVAFRRDAYVRAGGYREAFRVAQDLDLWLRLSELGRVATIERVIYEARWSRGSISALQRDRQRGAARLAWRAARARRAGRSDAAEVERARIVTSRPLRGAARSSASADYFLGGCLRGRDPAAARRYFRSAVAQNPFHLKALLRWLTTAPRR